MLEGRRWFARIQGRAWAPLVLLLPLTFLPLSFSTSLNALRFNSHDIATPAERIKSRVHSPQRCSRTPHGLNRSPKAIQFQIPRRTGARNHPPPPPLHNVRQRAPHNPPPFLLRPKRPSHFLAVCQARGADQQHRAHAEQQQAARRFRTGE